jgi:hypothetical protein
VISYLQQRKQTKDFVQEVVNLKHHITGITILLKKLLRVANVVKNLIHIIIEENIVVKFAQKEQRQEIINWLEGQESVMETWR